MDDKSLAALKAAKEGDRVRATVEYQGHEATVEGVAWDDPRGELFVGNKWLRYLDGEPSISLTAFEILEPAVPPMPPVGSLVVSYGTGGLAYADRRWSDATYPDAEGFAHWWSANHAEATVFEPKPVQR